MTNSLNVIYEDDVLLLCNKPAGLMVEPDRNNHPNLLELVKKYLKEKSGMNQVYVQHLHRLDRVTSGLVLFTKQKEFLKNLSEQFAQREVEKYYLAITNNKPLDYGKFGENCLLEHWHRKEKKKAVLVPEGTPFSEKAKLEYTIKPYGEFFLWEIKLLTGKYHQIRVQMTSLGCPIVGDELYGSLTSYNPNEIALHAFKLKIKHPVTHKEICFEAPADNFLANFNL